jgi:hypothetical protein
VVSAVGAEAPVLAPPQVQVGVEPLLQPQVLAVPLLPQPQAVQLPVVAELRVRARRPVVVDLAVSVAVELRSLLSLRSS